ncbi:uncharacterized protein Dvar_03670 [Desulfosarcina variabilis str. Montpellier]
MPAGSMIIGMLCTNPIISIRLIKSAIGCKPFVSCLFYKNRTAYFESRSTDKGGNIPNFKELDFDLQNCRFLALQWRLRRGFINKRAQRLHVENKLSLAF